MGSVLAIVPDRPRAVVIIDGVFERTPAVWHKEILFALSHGIRVFGASSMGALRAAELAPFGMEGIGRIFEMFRDGTLEDDDEVAVAHADAEQGYRCLSDAMVNLRDGLERAAAAGAISEATRDRLAAAAKERFYGERSWADLFAPRDGVPDAELDRLRGFVRAQRPDLKRGDAIAALRHVAAAGELAPHEPSFAFEKTDHWRHLLYREARSGGARVASLSRRVRATHPERLEVLRGAARLWALSAAGARATGREATEPAELEALADAVWRKQPHVDRFLAAELARRGHEVAPLAEAPAATPEERAAAAESYLAAHGPIAEDERDAHAQSLRFASWEDLLDEVAAARR
jgi:hypothetical protein